MRRAARTDATAKNLVAAARQLGLGYAHVGGVFDGVLWLGDVVALVDWKVPGVSALTEGQGKLVAAGCPLHFVSTIPQLELLAAQMRWNGLRRYGANQ